MKMNITVDLTAENLAELAGQMPQKEFSKVKKLIDEQARLRFGTAAYDARKEFKRAKLSRLDTEKALNAVRKNA